MKEKYHSLGVPIQVHKRVGFQVSYHKRQYISPF